MLIAAEAAEAAESLWDATFGDHHCMLMCVSMWLTVMRVREQSYALDSLLVCYNRCLSLLLLGSMWPWTLSLVYYQLHVAIIALLLWWIVSPNSCASFPQPLMLMLKKLHTYSSSMLSVSMESLRLWLQTEVLNSQASSFPHICIYLVLSLVWALHTIRKQMVRQTGPTGLLNVICAVSSLLPWMTGICTFQPLQ